MQDKIKECLEYIFGKSENISLSDVLFEFRQLDIHFRVESIPTNDTVIVIVKEHFCFNYDLSQNFENQDFSTHLIVLPFLADDIWYKEDDSVKIPIK